MERWTRTGALLAGMAASAWGGAQLGQAGQAEPVQVLVVNRPTQAVPVLADVSQIRRPVVLDALTTVGLREDTEVRVVPPNWEYREVRVPTIPGNTSSVLGALQAAGADGWETTGLSFNSPGATIIVMKRQTR
jgi:hypothetical protein